MKLTQKIEEDIQESIDEPQQHLNLVLSSNVQINLIPSLIPPPSEFADNERNESLLKLNNLVVRRLRACRIMRPKLSSLNESQKY